MLLTSKFKNNSGSAAGPGATMLISMCSIEGLWASHLGKNASWRLQQKRKRKMEANPSKETNGWNPPSTPLSCWLWATNKITDYLTSWFYFTELLLAIMLAEVLPHFFWAESAALSSKTSTTWSGKAGAATNTSRGLGCSSHVQSHGHERQLGWGMSPGGLQICERRRLLGCSGALEASFPNFSTLNLKVLKVWNYDQTFMKTTMNLVHAEKIIYRRRYSIYRRINSNYRRINSNYERRKSRGGEVARKGGQIAIKCGGVARKNARISCFWACIPCTSMYLQS